MAESIGIKELCIRIKADIDADQTGPNVKKMLSDYVLYGNGDYKEYIMFNDRRYARNLVEANEHFELMVICWKVGQVSPIHNHEFSACWMACVEGEIQEEYFHQKQKPTCSLEHPCCACPQLEIGKVSIHQKGEVGYISDEIALHRIRPSGDNCGVSIHIYSPPIHSCTVYCLESNKAVKTKLSYYSIYKVKQDNIAAGKAELCKSVDSLSTSQMVDSVSNSQVAIPSSE